MIFQKNSLSFSMITRIFKIFWTTLFEDTFQSGITLEGGTQGMDNFSLNGFEIENRKRGKNDNNNHLFASKLTHVLV